jgi:hypothetical protein
VDERVVQSDNATEPYARRQQPRDRRAVAVPRRREQPSLDFHRPQPLHHRRVAQRLRDLPPRLPVLPLDVDVAAGQHQRLHALRLVLETGGVEGRPAEVMVSHGAEGRTALQQQLQHLQATACRRLQQREGAISGHEVQVGAALEQQPRHLQMASPRCLTECGAVG